MVTKPIAIFDVDGTIFRSSLLIELNERLVKEKIFPEAARPHVVKAREAWLNRHGSYHDYIRIIIDLYSQDIAGVRVQDIERVARLVINEQKHRVYVYTRELIQKLRKTHTLIIISFSPLEAIQAFNKVYHFDFVSGVPYARRNGRFIGGVDASLVLDKKKILTELIEAHGLSLRNSVGVGDTDSDIAFLKLVKDPIAFNPNQELYRVARRNDWKIVVERKDVIYRI